MYSLECGICGMLSKKKNITAQGGGADAIAAALFININNVSGKECSSVFW
jgi:hypothetical protein